MIFHIIWVIFSLTPSWELFFWISKIKQFSLTTAVQILTTQKYCLQHYFKTAIFKNKIFLVVNPTFPAEKMESIEKGQPSTMNLKATTVAWSKKMYYCFVVKTLFHLQNKTKHKKILLHKSTMTKSSFLFTHIKWPYLVIYNSAA